jgi:hypothetical protein
MDRRQSALARLLRLALQNRCLFAGTYGLLVIFSAVPLFLAFFLFVGFFPTLTILLAAAGNPSPVIHVSDPLEMRDASVSDANRVESVRMIQ